MPGPLAGIENLDVRDFKLVAHRNFPLYFSPHTKCEKGQQCTGAGCRVNTGKTRRRVRQQHEGSRVYPEDSRG